VAYFDFGWNPEPALIFYGRQFTRCWERPMRKKLSIEQKWRELGEAFKQEAAQLPYGKQRDELLRKARQLETASHINEWISSPGLTPPT